MKPMGCFRAVTVAVMLVGGLLAHLPGVAAQMGPDDGTAPDAAVFALAQPGRQGASPVTGEGPGATLAVNVAIMGLGSLWLFLMARRMPLRGGGMLSRGMLSSGGPRHVAGGR